MTLEIIEKLSPEEYRLCQFVKGKLGPLAACELGLVLCGELEGFTRVSAGEITFIRTLADFFGISKELH